MEIALWLPPGKLTWPCGPRVPVGGEYRSEQLTYTVAKDVMSVPPSTMNEPAGAFSVTTFSVLVEENRIS